MFNPLRLLKHRLDLYFEEQIKSLRKKSGAMFIYRTKFGIDTYVHPEKLLDIIKTNTSCDAEPLLNSLSSILPPLGVSIDVGANIGIISCWLSRRSRVVYSFEPEESNIEFLKSNLILNDINNVDIYPVAVGAKDGSIEFCVRSAFGHHGIQKHHISDIVELRNVPIVTLDGFCKEKNIQRVSLLKIDVEGNELDVLMGFRDYISSKRVDIIVFEHAPILHKTAEGKMAVYDHLTKFGYVVFDITHRKMSRSDMLNAKQGDFYAKTI